jgi:hypothetical protein
VKHFIFLYFLLSSFIFILALKFLSYPLSTITILSFYWGLISVATSSFPIASGQSLIYTPRSLNKENLITLLTNQDSERCSIRFPLMAEVGMGIIEVLLALYSSLSNGSRRNPPLLV